MGNKIRVLVAQGLDIQKKFKDVPNFVKDVSKLLKDVPNFVKNVPRLPKSILRWGMTSDYFPRVFKGRNGS